MGRPSDQERVDTLFNELLAVGESAPRIREVLRDREIEDEILIALLRRAVPIHALEVVATTSPWSGRPQVLAAVVANPRVPSGLALRLLSSLFWRDLAEAARAPRAAGAVRVRAEGLILELFPDLRLGDRISLARIATARVVLALLGDREPRVLQGALENPRLREEDLLLSLRRDTVSRPLIEEVTSCWRWKESYAVRLTLALQPRTPVSIALGQLTSLRNRDLRRVSETPTVAPIVQAAAQRVLDGRGGSER